jgi:hypothetical protein
VGTHKTLDARVGARRPGPVSASTPSGANRRRPADSVTPSQRGANPKPVKAKVVKPEAEVTITQVYRQWGTVLLKVTAWAWERLHWKAQLGTAAVALLVWLWLGSNRPMFIMLVLSLTVLRFAVWHEHHRRAVSRGTVPAGWFAGNVHPRREFARALLPSSLLVFLALLGWPGHLWMLSAVATMLGAWTIWRELPEGEPVANLWHSHANLVEAIFHPSVLGPWREETLPRLRYLGQPATDVDAHGVVLGTWVKVALPGLSWEALAGKQVALAARLGVNRRMLTISPGDRTDGENVVRIWVGIPSAAKLTIAPVAKAQRTDWRKPVRIGVDMRGRVVHFQTIDVHSVLVAKTRAGKTWLARVILGHALLDPSVDIYVINGKDKRDDWRPMAPACVRYAAVDDEESLSEAMDVLDEVRVLCQARKDHATSDLTPVVLLLEEWFSVRSVAQSVDNASLKALDQAAARLGSVASGYGVHIIGLAQRGTADYVPMGLKANMGQRLVGMVAESREVGWTIGFTPADLPNAQGEFLVQTDEDPAVLTQGDALDDAAWAELCERAVELRGARVSRGTVNLDKLPAVPAVTLDGAVRELLADHGFLSSTELLGLLPAAVAPRTSAVLGKRLAEMFGVEQGYVGSRKGWRLAESAGGVAGGGTTVLPVDRQQNPRNPGGVGGSVPLLKVLEVQP